MKKKFFLIFSLLNNLFLFCQNTDEIDNNNYTKNCSYNNYGDYKPSEYKNIENISDISSKIKEYLFKRVDSFYLKKMYFKNVQIIDSTFFNKYFPDSKLKNHYNYHLCYSYVNINKGVGDYALNFVMDENGNIIKDIELPKRGNNNNSLKPLDEIKKKAIKIKFYKKDKTKIDLIYMADKDLLVWKLINEEYKGGGELLQHVQYYNAHSGKFLGLETIKLNVIE